MMLLPKPIRVGYTISSQVWKDMTRMNQHINQVREHDDLWISNQHYSSKTYPQIYYQTKDEDIPKL